MSNFLKLQPWLTHSGSFMKRLKEHRVEYPEIEVLKHRFEFPSLAERISLNIKPRHYALIREVMIKSHEKQWMFARTVFPQESLTGSLRQLIHLKNKSLGSVLFKNPHLIRSECEFYCVDENEDLWGRRSTFIIQHKAILLDEIFLQDLLCL